MLIKKYLNMHKVFNLEEEYKLNDVFHWDDVLISARNFKEIDKFEFSWQFEKPIDLFFNNISIKNFFFDNILGKHKFNIKNITFLDVDFKKVNNSHYSRNEDFIYSDDFWKLQRLEIGYNNKTFNCKVKLAFYHFKIIDFSIYDTWLSNNEWYENIDKESYYFRKKYQSYFKEIIISNPKELWNLSISNIKIWKLILEDIKPIYDSFQLINLDIGELIIRNSDLSNVSFNWLHLKKITLLNSNIQDSIFNWVYFKSYEIWTEIVEEERKRKKTYKLSDLQLKDNYRQLKFVMDKNWNHTEANKFFEMEMFYYEKIVDSKKIFEKWWLKKLHKEWFSSINAGLIWEKIVLFLWDIISNHWNNFIKPIFLIFMLAFLATDVKFLYDYFPLLSDSFKDYTFYQNASIRELLSWVSSLILTMFLYIWIFLISKKFIYSTILGSFIIIQFWLWYNIFWSFMSFLLPFAPIYWLDFSSFKELNIIETIWLWIYKIFYWIILWHLIVAAKRTTRR